MAELSESDRLEMQSAAAQALVGDQAEMMDMRAVDLGDIRGFFCENWETIKKVLQFIADTVGGIVKLAIRAIIAAGDLLHGRICRG